MKWKDEDLPALRELEAAVVQLWLQHPEMNDYMAGRACETACQHYRARFRGHEPKPPALSGLDLDTFKAVQTICEKLLSSGAKPVSGMPRGNTQPLTLEKLMEYPRNRSPAPLTRARRTARPEPCTVSPTRLASVGTTACPFSSTRTFVAKTEGRQQAFNSGTQDSAPDNSRSNLLQVEVADGLNSWWRRNHAKPGLRRGTSGD
jgi:hypothetical protein